MFSYSAHSYTRLNGNVQVPYKQLVNDSFCLSSQENVIFKLHPYFKGV